MQLVFCVLNIDLQAMLLKHSIVLVMKKCDEEYFSIEV